MILFDRGNGSIVPHQETAGHVPHVRRSDVPIRKVLSMAAVVLLLSQSAPAGLILMTVFSLPRSSTGPTDLITQLRTRLPKTNLAVV